MRRGCDAVAENSASFIDSTQPHELLAGHEEGRHIRRIVARQFGKTSQAGVVIAFFVEFHRETVTQKRVARIIGEHGYDFFAARHYHTLC